MINCSQRPSSFAIWRSSRKPGCTVMLGLLNDAIRRSWRFRRCILALVEHCGHDADLRRSRVRARENTAHAAYACKTNVRAPQLPSHACKTNYAPATEGPGLKFFFKSSQFNPSSLLPPRASKSLLRFSSLPAATLRIITVSLAP
jgi:hypothetical protein